MAYRRTGLLSACCWQSSPCRFCKAQLFLAFMLPLTGLLVLQCASTPQALAVTVLTWLLTPSLTLVLGVLALLYSCLID